MPRVRVVRRALAVGLLVLCAADGPLGADEATDALLRSTRALRETFAPPTPAIAYEYAGDLVVRGLWAGEVRFTARAARIGRQAVWRVHEAWFQDWGGVEVQTEVTLHLAKNLAISSGAVSLRSKPRTVQSLISRTDEGFVVVAQGTGEEADGAEGVRAVPAPADATGGMGALLLFLRAAPAPDGAHHALPWMPSADWLVSGKTASPKTARMRVLGERTYPAQAGALPTWAVEWWDASGRYVLHLTRDRRGMVAMTGTVGERTFAIVPRGEGGGRAVELDAGKPAATWKDAFLKFGYGYHMANRDLLAAAFHWEGMYDHETRVLKRWPAERPLTDFREAWIDEFVSNSKHRSRGATARLLAMTLASGKLTLETERAVFAAHANFGGGVSRTYHLERRDGVWGIVRIDS